MLDINPILLLATFVVFVSLIAVLNSWLYNPLLSFMNKRDDDIKKDLEKVKNQTKMDFINLLESPSGVSSVYGDYFARGDITPLLEYEEKINSLTPSKIEEVKKYFDKSVEVKLISL